MPKRSLDDAIVAVDAQRLNKRPKVVPDRLSALSDEVILRILHHVPVETLAVCARVSARLKTLANDSQIWKAAYYDRFLRPRLQKISRRPPASSTPTARAAPSSRLARWLDEDKLVQRGNETNWKRQYKIRDNWSRGLCNLDEIPLGTPPVPALLARLHAGIIITADRDEGLRAWSYKGERKLVAQCAFSSDRHSQPSKPTALAVDGGTEDGVTRVVAGFDDGSFGLYDFDCDSSAFASVYLHPASRNGMVSGIAICHPYVVTMSHTHTFSLYRFGDDTRDAPLLLTSLKSHSVWPPFSLTLRLRAGRILACIAYALPSLSSGWSTGVQELHISPDGEIEDSRLTSSDSSSSHSSSNMEQAQGQASSPEEHQVQQFSKPTSLSYSHPYLLVSHADNTLTFYLITSSEHELTISPGKRLWGHTSSVFGAQVGGRGKAVSVSSRGDEVRVWELEGATLQRRRHGEEDGYSVQIRPEQRSGTPARLTGLTKAVAERGGGLGLALEHATSEASVTKCWVGFDEENVVVVRERDEARQALAVYDFT